MGKPSRYKYTTLQNLPDSGRVNVYGVVYSITALAFGGQIIEITDEHATVYAKISKESENFFKKLQIKDILRLHRVEVGSYRGEKTLIVEIGECGCHAVAWSGSSTKPKLTTSKKYTFGDQDVARRSELLKWCEDGEVEGGAPSTSENANPRCENPPPQKTSTISPTKENVPMKLPKPNTCQLVKSASEIPSLWSKFFNWYAEVLGVYKGKGDPFTVFVKVWDGSFPRFPDYRNMFRADSDSVETTFCETTPAVLAAIDEYTIDVCCYGEWATKALKLEVGDIVLFSNVRNYVCKSNNSSAVTMHEGGTVYNRALTVVDKSDPIHFDIAKRCADSLAKCLGSDSNLIDVASDVNVTPIVADDVLAQSTPIVSKKPAKDIAEPPAAARISSVDNDTGGSVAAEPPPYAEEPMEIAGDTEAVDDVEDEINCLPEDIREQFLETEEAACRCHEMNYLMKQVSEPRRFPYSLTDEMEAVLKMKVGQNVRISNFIEADLNVLKTTEYLRSTSVYTAVCIACGGEFIIERDPPNWYFCPKCFADEHLLREVKLSYRVRIPAAYTRRDGQMAYLFLAIPSEMWAAVPGNRELMSAENVMQLYSERSLSLYLRNLNRVLRFAEAVVTKMKISNVCGKIYTLDRETGSVDLMVDQCSFTERGTSNEILF